MKYLCPSCGCVLKETHENKNGKTKLLFLCVKCQKIYDFKLILKEVERK
jgi:hypothetical protein